MTDRPDTMTSAEDAALARFFADARAREPLPGADVLGRILEDAATVSAGSPERAGHQRQPRWSLRRLLEPVGGWGGAGALAASAILGIGVGLSGSGPLASVPGVTEISDALVFDLDTALADYTLGMTAIFDDLEG